MFLLTAAALRALPWGRIAVAAAFVAAVGVIVAWHVHRVDLARAQGLTAGRAEVQALWDKATIDLQQLAERTHAERRKIEQDRAAALVKEIEDAQQAAENARLDADRARAAGERLRDAARAVAARCRPTSVYPPAPGSSAPRTDPTAVLAELPGWLEAAGREYAEEAQRRGIAGSACERIHDGLRASGQTPR